MYPDDLFIPGPQDTDTASTTKCASPGVDDDDDSTVSTDESGPPPPYPGPPTLPYGFFRVIDESIFIATGSPQRLHSADGGQQHHGGSPRHSPTSWSRRSSSRAALRWVRWFWVTLFVASMLFIAGVATTGLAYAKGVDFHFRRHGMLMILAAAVVVIAAAVFNLYRIIKYGSSHSE
ncbi:hypothetical protein HPB50_004863 [Hyalomma asiaticum]|uniref:Uncharacterized protein n=1 Tax=Hyalomma asiaticum TaxID=266040 RepID=A0ACB7SCK8_HYAAI|nr:hypothetical protein HPB50_004863 [Hyalomma asiaticum]